MRWNYRRNDSLLWNTIGRDSAVIDYICKRFKFSSTYIICIGLLGTAFGIIDAVKITQYGDILPPFMRRTRLKGHMLSVKKERDLKLMSTVFTLTCHFFLAIGALMNYALLIYPWFLMQTVMILVELLVFFIKLNSCRTSCITKDGALIACFTLLNWKQVFCLLREILIRCGSCCY